MNITVQAPQPGICVGRLTSDDLPDALALARAHGWTCVPPSNADDALPHVEPGVFWKGPDPGDEVRMVDAVQGHLEYGLGWQETVSYRAIEERWLSETRKVPLHIWNTWARRTGAWPATP